MKLCVSEIKESGADIKIAKPAAYFPLLAELERQELCVFLTPVTVNIQANVLGGMVELTGMIRAEIEVPCSRCLAPCRCELNAAFHQSFVESLPRVTGEDGEELELSAFDMGLEQFSDDIIDLTDEIQQQVILLLPEHPLCDDSCRGMCQICGGDLNKTQCKCAESVVSLNFSALKDFKVDK